MSLIKTWPQEITGGPPSQPPRRLNAATSDDADDGVACTAVCLPFPRFSKKKKKLPAVKPRKSARKAETAGARRATSWWLWLSSHHATPVVDAAAATGATTPDDDDGSASFKYWGQSPSRSQLSPLVTPRASSSSSTFSFPSSPASACSFASTPKIGPGS